MQGSEQDRFSCHTKICKILNLHWNELNIFDQVIPPIQRTVKVCLPSDCLLENMKLGFPDECCPHVITSCSEE